MRCAYRLKAQANGAIIKPLSRKEAVTVLPQELPIAFFDSGLGGISVLREAVRILPHEHYIYYGDSLHAPYGVKTPEQVLALTRAAVEHLQRQGVKVLVIACNTATSAAIQTLRQEHPELIMIGTEPAIKPAAERFPGGRILVMATPMTLKETKFRALQRQYGTLAEIIPVACGGLMEFVEQGILRGQAVEGYLYDKLEPYLKVPIDAVVLGCTHYPFLTGAIRRVIGRKPVILDGSTGIAMQLRRKLSEQGLLREGLEDAQVRFENSLNEPEILALSQALLDYRDEED